MQSGMRGGGVTPTAARLAPNAASLYIGVIGLGGSWWIGLVVGVAFVAAVIGSSLRWSRTEWAVDRALRTGEQRGVSWALVDTEAKRRLAAKTGPRFWVLFGLVTAVVLVAWVTVGGFTSTPARTTGAVLLVLSCAPAAWGERVVRRQAARWLAAGAAGQRVAGGAVGHS